MVRLAAVVAVTLAFAPASHAASARIAQSYAGLQDRPVKALSGQRLADLRAGRGMGLALAAELNGYPGPAHVLEHADALRLGPTQRARTRALHDAMKAETIPLGERLIARETDLDRRFRERTITPASLAAATGAVGAAEAALRAAHLRYHLLMAEVLTPEQTRRYGELRGYAGAPGGDGHGGHRPDPG